MKGKGVKQPNGPAEFLNELQFSSVGPREWGEELVMFLCKGHYTFKLIKMNKGGAGGLQYHHKKDEGGYLISGKLHVLYDPGTGELAEHIATPGQAFHFRQGCVHKVTALEDSVYVEVSTPYLNDRVNVAEHYGIKEPEGGLPTTALKDVVE